MGTAIGLLRRRSGSTTTGVVAASIALAALASCSLIHVDPVTAEQRSVTPVTDPSKTVTLNEPVVWLNAPAYRASKGIRLPSGLYTLEAEDADYWYFRAPAPIEMRVLDNGTPVDGPDIPGGLALAKATLTLTSPAAYIDVDADHKMLVMKLGSEFVLMRGNQWDRSF